MNLSDADLAKIAAILDTDQAIKVYWDGVLSQGPVSFNVEFFAKVKITAKSIMMQC